MSAPAAPFDRIPEALLIIGIGVILAVALASGGWVLVAAAALPIVLYRRHRASARNRVGETSGGQPG